MGDQEETNNRLEAEVKELQAQRDQLSQQVDALQSEERHFHWSESQCRAVIAALEEGIVVQDRDGVIIEANPSAARLLMLPLSEIVGRSTLDPRWETIHEDGSPFPGFMHPGMETIRTGEPQSNVVMGLRQPGGQITWVSVCAQPIRLESGSGMRGAVCSFFDITRRKETERELRRRAETFRALTEHAPDIIFRLDRECRHVYVNPAVEDAVGLPPEQLLGKNHEELGMPGHLVRMWRHHVERIFAEGSEDALEFTFETPRGPRSFQSRLVPEFDAEGHVETVLGVARDITDQKRIEHQLATSEAWLKEAQRVAHVGSWIYELETERITLSEELYRIYGLSPSVGPLSFEEILGYIHPDDRARMAEERAKLSALHGPMNLEHRIVRADGTERFAVTRAQVLNHPDGRPYALVGILQDVTEIKEAEAAIARHAADLRQAREMDRLKSNLLDAVSHELRTPLTSIKGYAEFLEDDVAGELNSVQRGFVTQIQEGAQRLERLVDDLLDFARLEAGSFRLSVQPTDMNALVRRSVESLKPQSGRHRISVESPAGPLTALVDPKRTEQVLLNLLDNAIKFTPSGGSLTVRLTSTDGLLSVEVIDTGIGIPPEHLAHLFDKFYQVDPGSTRQHGGAGLGLSIAKALVEAQGGHITVESAPNRGSTFRFTVPRPPAGPA